VIPRPSCQSPASLVFGLAALLAAGPSLASGSPWMPVEIGAKKTFVHRQDRTIESHGESLGDERWVGTREEQVLLPPSPIAGATAEVRVTTRMSNATEEQVETQRLFVSPTPSAYQIHAAELEANGQRYAIEYPSPAVALLENPTAGQKWHVSSEDVAGLKGDTWGEVVGIQDARTPAGLFEGCLVVRYTVDLSGTLEIPGAGKMDVTEGRMVVTEWHAKGVGMVLAKEELSETLVGPNGVEITAGMKSQTALKLLEGMALPASPAP
jgi:hypothetical protein